MYNTIYPDVNVVWCNPVLVF